MSCIENYTIRDVGLKTRDPDKVLPISKLEFGGLMSFSCRGENVHVHGMGHPAESADGCPFRWNDPPTRFSWEPFTDKYRHRYFPPRSLARNHT